MKFLNPFFVLLLSTLTTSMAQGPRLQTSPPKEMNQFQFMVGTWHCKYKIKQSDGSYIDYPAVWQAYFTLEGFAFQDDFKADLGNGTYFRGTTWRTFLPKENKWLNIFLPPNQDLQKSPNSTFFYGEWIDGEMRLSRTGTKQKETYTDRFVFSQISSDQFTWHMDRSYDDGDTWLERIVVVEAKRSREQ